MRYIGLELLSIVTNVARAVLNNELEQIKGISKTSATLLLQKFKSVKNIKEKTEEELAAEVLGSAKSKIVYNYFHLKTKASSDFAIQTYIKNKKKYRIEIQPRFKIQYPMKNRCEDKRNLPLITSLQLTEFIQQISNVTNTRINIKIFVKQKASPKIRRAFKNIFIALITPQILFVIKYLFFNILTFQ